MGIENGRKFSRRDFLIRASATTILAACDGEFIFQREQDRQSESLPNIPRMGDVVIVGNQAFLLRDNKAYPIPDLERYKKLTKFDKYGRGSFSLERDIFAQYPPAQLPTVPEVIDPFSGQFKKGKPFGGEINVYFPGFITDNGVPFDVIKPAEDTFVEIRKKLMTQKWELFDSIFFTYGERGLGQYHAKETGRSPQENIREALAFFEQLKKDYPLAQFNFIAHSLGGIFALEAARKNPDAINNFILISSPVRGIDGNPVRRVQTQVAKQVLKPYVGDEKASDYLFDLWGNKKYQKELEQFGESFTKMGRGLTTVASEDDPIVPKESQIIKGAGLITLRVGDVPFSEYLVAHGRPLKSGLVVNAIAERIGENLADIFFRKTG